MKKVRKTLRNVINAKPATILLLVALGVLVMALGLATWYPFTFVGFVLILVVLLLGGFML